MAADEKEQIDDRLTFEVADGDYNREIVVEAGKNGLIIEEFVTLDWEWILAQAAKHAKAK